MHSRNCFITLTYDDTHCPEKINRRDPQLFMKRLRQKLDRKIRYFLTGEYGEKTQRPHYHAIIFGEDFLGGSYSTGERLYTNPHLSQIWGQGNVEIGDFNIGSAMYTAGYTAKKVGNDDTFSIMSKRPAIGGTWIRENYASLWHLEKCIINGREYPIPKAYERLLQGDALADRLRDHREQTERLSDRQLDAKEIHYRQNELQRIRNEIH